ncbi:unnamed protein product [Dicrocoelium dendriticum]|nr:unnamed protein product [Dicrocoelium dendriticum]
MGILLELAQIFLMEIIIVAPYVSAFTNNTSHQMNGMAHNPQHSHRVDLTYPVDANPNVPRLVQSIKDAPFDPFTVELITTVLHRMTNMSTDNVNSTTSLRRQRRNIHQNLVRVKLQAFIFEVQMKRLDPSNNAATHLRQVMHPFSHMPLDPQYTEKIITAYNPLVMQDEVCKEFEDLRTDKHVANTFFIINDVGTFVPRPLHDRLHRLLFQITSALGIPTITWLPNRVGQFELDDSQLAIRLEPLAWHVSYALVDFMYAYNWNMIILVYNTMVSGSSTLVEQMRERQAEHSVPDNPKYFPFEITHELEFTGLNATGYNLCIKPYERILRPCMWPMVNILHQIWLADARIVIFNGDFYDLNTLLYIADSLRNTQYEYLNELFDKRYVWIFTPSTMSSLTVADSQENVSVDNQVLKESTMFRRIPGMFGLICLNDLERRRKSAELAREVWQKSMIELTYQLTTIYPPETQIQLDSITPATLAYFGQVLSKLRPEKLCQDSEHLTWQWGRRMYDIMRSLAFTFRGEPISFMPNGGLNVSTMYVYNSRTTSGRMDWHKVGTWSMSSRWGKFRSRLRIDGVTWPGGANSPPKGRPNKFKLRVVTIKERPFVIYHRLGEDGACDANSLPCKLRPVSIADLDAPIKGSYAKLSSGLSAKQTTGIRHTGFDNLSRSSAINNFTDYVNGCCAGLTMDLLMELMKDLNFEADLFEVPDGLWGAWTPDGWNGIIRTLMDNEADMAITSLKITPNRSQQVEFSVPFLETGIAVTVALREGAISPTAFLKPYDYQAWCLILLFSVHASGAALFLFEWLSPNGLNRGRNAEHRFTFFRSLWLIWSMLFGAAVNADNPRGVASRFLANIWALFALVFLASYTANLAAFMIAKEDYYDLSGMNDWRLQQPWNVKPPFRFATIPSGATEENIKINFPEMSTYIQKFNRSTVEEGLKALKAGELDAFIYDANVLDYWASKDEGCKLRIVGNLYAMTGYGIGFAKGSRWLEKVNSRILDYQKNGKLQRWKKFWQTGSCRKDSALGNTNKTLGVKNFISAFILLLCGIFICSLLLALEYLVCRYVPPKYRRLIGTTWCTTEVRVNQFDPTDERKQFSVRHCEQTMNGNELQSAIDHVSDFHKCDNPQCHKQLVELRRQIDQLREKMAQLRTGMSNHEQNKPWTAVDPSLPAIKKRTGVRKLPCELVDDVRLTVNHSSSIQAANEKRKQRSTSEQRKLWDIYSKVAVIPIEPNTIVHKGGTEKQGSENPDETCTIILPKLASSPSSRRRRNILHYEHVATSKHSDSSNDMRLSLDKERQRTELLVSQIDTNHSASLAVTQNGIDTLLGDVCQHKRGVHVSHMEKLLPVKQAQFSGNDCGELEFLRPRFLNNQPCGLRSARTDPKMLKTLRPESGCCTTQEIHPPNTWDKSGKVKTERTISSTQLPFEKESVL